MDQTHYANLAYSTACSLSQLAKTIPYVDQGRKDQLMQHAKAMVAPFGFTLSSYDDAIQDAITRLMSYVPSSIPRPV